jgi:secreted trypsin-like serine protease
LNTWFGDSGGPALGNDASGQQRLIGVTSWGDEDCKQFGVDTRVDAFWDFLQPYLDDETAPADPGGDNGGGSDFCADEGWYDDGW